MTENNEIIELKQALAKCKHFSALRRQAVEVLIVSGHLKRSAWERALEFVGTGTREK